MQKDCLTEKIRDMKNLKMLYIALIALVAGAFGACTNEFEPGSQVNGPQASFAPENPTSFEFSGEEGEGTKTITLTRVKTDDALMVDIIAEVEKGAEKLFNIPEFASFEAGEATTTLTFTVDHEKFESDKTYTVKLYLDDSVSTPYGYAEWTMTFALNPWELMTDDKGNNAKGKFRGNDLISSLLDIDTSVEIDVNVYEHKSRKGYYKVEDPWALSAALGFGYSSVEEAEADGLGVTHADFLIDASNPNQVVFAQQAVGVDIGYGDMIIESGYPRYMENPAAGAGTLSEGIITFPTKGCIFAMPGYKDSAYYGNIDGMFRIVLPGVEIADYSLAVAYDGMDVAADNKTTTAKFKFTYGADVTGIDYMIVEGNQENQASTLLSTLVAGTDENILSVEDFEVGKGEANVKVGLESGIYTIVAAPADKAGALRTKEALVQSFYFAGMGNTEEHPCEIGVIATKFSEAYPSYASQYPDYSAFAYCVYGTGIKSAKYLVAATSAFEEMAAEGVDAVALVNEYGEDITAANLAKVNSENGWVYNAINLDASTEYTIAVYATNEYGESALATVKHTTDAAPEYTGELVIGQYYMSCLVETQQGSQTFENVFTVTPNGDNFLISDLGVNDDGKHKFHAVYDSTASTLTIDGTYYGMEQKGSLFAAILYGEAGDYAYTIFSNNSAESKGNDPIVFGVDPTTKQISSLQTAEFEVAAFAPSGNSFSYVGSFAIFQADGTTIVPYTATASKQSVKAENFVPYRNATAVRAPKANIKSKIEACNTANIASENLMKTKSVKSVKPSLVENYTPAKVRGFAIKANAAVVR